MYEDDQHCRFCGQPASRVATVEAEMTFEALTAQIRQLRATVAELRGLRAERTPMLVRQG